MVSAPFWPVRPLRILFITPQSRTFSIITAGPIPPNPSELLSSEKMKNLITKLSDVYDMIIVDSPPVLNVSDALLLSKNVRGVMIVSWAGSTTYDMVRKGLKLINEISAPLIGMVLNRLDAKKEWLLLRIWRLLLFIIRQKD